jgi:hypothetical protein
MPVASSIIIRCAGVDITNKVLYAGCRFEGQHGAIPGMAEVTVKDLDQTFSVSTGDELEMELDGVPYWGGFIRKVERLFALPVVDTSDPGSVVARQFKLTAVDWNIMFDSRVIHNPADHLHHLPYFQLDKTMGYLLRTKLFADYIDDMSDFDTTTYIDNVYVPRFDEDGNPDPDASKRGSFVQQGEKLRKQMDDFAQFGAVYYIDAAKNVHFHEIEDTVAPWGFSDVPNKLPLGTPGATYGMREYEDSFSNGAMANDAFVWGGSEWAGSGGTRFKRRQNASSITAHKRWQYAEVRFGDLRTQGEVTARAHVIVDGNTTGAVGGDTSRGMAKDEISVTCVWFAHDVPFDGPIRAHLKPSDVVTFYMYVLSENGVDPSVITLPLRSVNITFPTIPSDGSPQDPLTYVRFEGKFGLQLSDPWYFWKLLRDLRPVVQPIVAAADGSTTAAVYGTLGSFEPSPATNGSVKVFTIPFAYIEGTTQVYKGPPGQLSLLTLGTHYTESDPASGEITFVTAPSTDHDLWVICRVAGGIS